MTATLRQSWASLPARHRFLGLLVLTLTGIGLYAWLLMSAARARAELQTHVDTLRPQASRLDRHAEELMQLSSEPPAAPVAGDLLTRVRHRLDNLNLAPALVRIDAAGKQRVSIELDAVEFAQWLQWTEDLSTQQIRLETCEIEALATPGWVRISATLAGGPSP